MSTPFQTTALAASLTAAIGFSLPVFAQTENTLAKVIPILKLDTIVVTATRSEEKITNIPARISIIEPNILVQSPIAELPHLLMSDAAINMVQSGGFGQQASIFTRGTNSTHTLVLRDGVRLNSASAGLTPLSFLDTTDIKQVEILKGPASVLYGTDAIGGVVQLITKTPEKSGGFVTGEIGEHQTYKAVVGADLAQDGIYAQIRTQRLETDGTAVTNTPNSEKAAYDQLGYSAKFGIEKNTYAASIDYSSNQGSSLYDNYGNMLSQDFDNKVINLKARINLLDSLSLHARLSHFKDDLDQNDNVDYVHNTTQEAELYSKWQFAAQQNLLMGAAHKKLQGDVLSLSDWSTVKYQQDVTSTGYFVQHQYQGDRLNTQVGVRVEDNEKFGSHTVGQLAARYHFTPSTSVYSNIGTAFRAPTTNDLYAVGWGANPDLKPEESQSFEVGLDQKITEKLSFGISTYRNEIDQLITFSNDQLRNVNKATFTGGETNLNWKHEHLFLNLSYAYVSAKNDETKLDLTRRPRHSATLSAGWEDSVYGVSASVSAKSDSKDFADWPSTTLTQNPGYMTTDLNAFWNLNSNIKVFSNIQNIGDVKYKTAYNGSNVYYVNGGRLASLGVTLKY